MGGESGEIQDAAPRLEAAVVLFLAEYASGYGASADDYAINCDGDCYFIAQFMLSSMENVSQATEQWYLTLQLTVYLNKVLDDPALKVIGILKQEDSVAKINYLSREETMCEFRNWSSFGGRMDVLEENPAADGGYYYAKVNFQSATKCLKRCATVLPLPKVWIRCA